MLTASLDPGKWKMGLAVSEDGVLIWAGPVIVPRNRDHGPTGWSEAIAIEAIYRTLSNTRNGRADRWLVERPGAYPGAGVALKKDAKQLQSLADEFAKRRRSLHEPVRLVRPYEWKGQIPKSVHHRRLLKFLSCEEQLNIHADVRATRLDVWDAVGLELFHNGRVGKAGIKK